MKNYYFTYGTSEKYPFKGGWTTVMADTKELAIRAYRLFHPDRSQNCLNCCDCYSPEYFEKSKMFLEDDKNLDYGEQERIQILSDEDGNVISVNLLEKIDTTFDDLKSVFAKAEDNKNPSLTGYIIFSADSFSKKYSETSRTYKFSSDNKLFRNSISSSLFGSCLDGTDQLVRLDKYMAELHGGSDGWKVEKCYYYRKKEL